MAKDVILAAAIPSHYRTKPVRILPVIALVVRWEHRDEYSVQLHKAEAEDALVQIDLFYKKIIFRGQEPKVVYPILSALKELPSAAEEAGETSTNDD